ncbi:hypothetical protein [Thalassoglobus sp.]|uniref:hypothetical protein n=1 Tax=Thalassoglobus sp. TaxID=2795869 RepID=UPI003AA914D7
MLQELSPAQTMLAHFIDPRITSIRSAHLHRKAEERAEQTFGVIKTVTDLPIQKPVYRNAEQFSEELVSQLFGERVGRLDYVNGQIVAHWFEKHRKRGLMQHDWRLERHEHTLTRTRFKHLPYTGCMPRRAQEIHDAICSVPALMRSCRVLEGTVVGLKEDVVERWKEDTAFKVALDNAKQRVGEAAQGVRRGVERFAESVRSLPVFLGDPIIVVGSDLAIYGWLE